MKVSIYPVQTLNRLTFLFVALSTSAMLPAEIEAQPLPPKHMFRDCSSCPDMIVIPSGSFLMGTMGPLIEGTPEDVDQAERPAHRVELPNPIAIGIHEITHHEYAQFADATNAPDGDQCFVWNAEKGVWENRDGVTWRRPGFVQTPEHPVVCVSWNEANAYTRWLSKVTGASYRLLSEAEWEYAARANSSTVRPWGNTADDACVHGNVNDLTRARLNPALSNDSQSAFQCEDGHQFTAPVGSFVPNAFGLFDMVGNVWEWTADCFNASYDGIPGHGRPWQTGDCTQRMNRGGSWADPPWRTRSAVREWDPPHGRYALHGFRVARDID